MKAEHGANALIGIASLLASPVVTVVAWWSVISLMGWSVFPILFVGFPSLSDRGYAFSKAVGLFVVAWIAWFATSLHVSLCRIGKGIGRSS
ncbi:MAG UNVERIFIED_CONTAM: hypothetical protein LVT10_14495 [Anaerolineae bacterium]